MPERSPYQQRIIRNYYKNQGTILLGRLAELVSELYLSEGKALDRNWKRVEETLEKLDLSSARVRHALDGRDPARLAELVKQLQSQ